MRKKEVEEQDLETARVSSLRKLAGADTTTGARVPLLAYGDNDLIRQVMEGGWPRDCMPDC